MHCKLFNSCCSKHVHVTLLLIMVAAGNRLHTCMVHLYVSGFITGGTQPSASSERLLLTTLKPCLLLMTLWLVTVFTSMLDDIDLFALLL
jgi:hypothetical protein